MNYAGDLADSAVKITRLEFQAVAGGHYSRVKSLSRLLAPGLFALFALFAFPSGAKTQTAPAQTPATSPQQLFQQGEAALTKNNLDLAERSFRAVLAQDPQAAGAYANLGVISMRRKQWPQALEMFGLA